MLNMTPIGVFADFEEKSRFEIYMDITKHIGYCVIEEYDTTDNMFIDWYTWKEFQQLFPRSFHHERIANIILKFIEVDNRHAS